MKVWIPTPAGPQPTHGDRWDPVSAGLYDPTAINCHKTLVDRSWGSPSSKTSSDRKVDFILTPVIMRCDITDNSDPVNPATGIVGYIWRYNLCTGNLNVRIKCYKSLLWPFLCKHCHWAWPGACFYHRTWDKQRLDDQVQVQSGYLKDLCNFGLKTFSAIIAILQSSCTSMCRDIYNWNIVDCDVKQPTHFSYFNAFPLLSSNIGQCIWLRSF